MNAVEIEQAVSDLVEREFDADAFPFAFLEAFDNKSTTIKRLKSGESNKSDIGGVLQTHNIHILVCPEGEVNAALNALQESPATRRAKSKFILATDGAFIEAENINTGETLVCDYDDLPKHFGFFLPLAGISYTKELKDTELDRNASRRLQKLYIELSRSNPDWGASDRRHDMNHFMARLIFCFFAEDTDIFHGENFTSTVEQMSDRNSSNTHNVISAVFQAMNTPKEDRKAKNIRSWADRFPYVNGGLFNGSTETPRFTKIARSYLLHAGRLDWKKINPDIFGSMIQTVADDDERGTLGMHYTSVPNILKVLNPLFIDNLDAQLEQAKGSPRKLLNLRKRIANIRVFDPACGSGNFLVIAYKKMREIEAEINRQRNEENRPSVISLKNFRGIELRDFPAEIARLALIIAEYQCDVVYRGQQLAIDEFLPLDTQNWIIRGNALAIDWLSVCPPTGTKVKLSGDDLFSSPEDQAEVDFDNEGGETYICGNPPYLGSTWQSKEQKADLESIFKDRTKNWKSLDYVAGWFMKAADYGKHTNSAAAFVSTNSICQGQQVPILWPLIFSTGHEISFAHASFKWANLASHNAGVTVVIVGISRSIKGCRQLFDIADNGEILVKDVENINAYLVAGKNVQLKKNFSPLANLTPMIRGSSPVDGGGLLMNRPELRSIENESKETVRKYIKKIIGSEELINGKERYCLWIEDSLIEEARHISHILNRLERVKNMRSSSRKSQTVLMANTPHKFGEIKQVGNEIVIAVAVISSENRDYLPCGLLPPGTIVSNKCFAFFDAPLWNMALIASRLHWVWIATVCARMRTDFSYSNTLGWNTFPVPRLTENNKKDLTHCAQDILVAREAHFPATIADLYNPEKMPEDLRRAHERNDEVLERIYIGRRFRNDTERLEKLFALYTKMSQEKVY